MTELYASMVLKSSELVQFGGYHRFQKTAARPFSSVSFEHIMRHRPPLKIGFVSLGCPKNLVDTEVMMGQLVERGHQLTPHPADADVLVVNTCSFIDPAKQESVDTILDMAEYKKSGKARKLIALSRADPAGHSRRGCGAGDQRTAEHRGALRGWRSCRESIRTVSLSRTDT